MKNPIYLQLGVLVHPRPVITQVRTEGCNWGKNQREEGDIKLAILERRFH
jgi:hypothetical protein